MNKEVLGLEAKKIGEIFGIVGPNLTSTKRQQFIGLIRSWAAQKNTINNLHQESDQLLTPFTEDAQYGQILLRDIEERFYKTREFIYNPDFRWFRGNLEAQIGRIKVSIGILQEHPWLSPLIEERQIAVAFAGDAEKRKSAEENEVQAKYNPLIEQAERTLSKIEVSLLNFSENAVLPSLDLIKQYSRILPFRTEAVIEKYGKTFYLDSTRMVDSERFMQLINPYVERRAKRGNTFQIVKEQIQLGKGLPYDKLPDELVYRLQSWISYQLALMLSKEGIIREPALPSVFQS